MVDEEKQVILFIAEGPSDEAALGTIMAECFSNDRVRFHVVHGDITTRDYVDIGGIVSKIKEQIDIVELRYHYRDEDFISIIHLVDTDGVFVPNDKVVPLSRVPDEEAASVLYFTDRMEARNVQAIRARNNRKAKILYKLRKTGQIKHIPYRVYFNSCNLEHVLYGELREFSDDEKEEMADSFAEKFENRAEDFVDFISGKEIAVVGTYQKTWDFIEKDLNSLNRHSNMNQIFTHNTTSCKS